ncbi:MAG: S1C family serine protease [Bryobacteraceae bacterium]|nr:S1C family serine protease [Bryobacteraceae bacterium]
MTGFGEVAEQLRRSTVSVAAGRNSGGSGVVWNRDGLIVTNAHVARSNSLQVSLWDGRRYAARLLAQDSRRDLATLKIEAPDLETAIAADSGRLRPGELVVAVGNPLGFTGALSTGTVHAVGAVRGLGPQRWVQANIRLAPGNSGGPLADAHGRVVGLNTMVVSGGLGLAVRSEAITRFIEHGPDHARLGVSVQPVRPSGLLLLEVDPDSPAGRASLLPGDVLDHSLEELEHLLTSRGGQVTLRFRRGDRFRTRTVTVQL